MGKMSRSVGLLEEEEEEGLLVLTVCLSFRTHARVSFLSSSRT